MGIPRYFVSVLTVLLVSGACSVLLATAEFKFIQGTVSSYFVLGKGEDLVINCTTNDPNAAIFLYRKKYYGIPTTWELLLPKANNIIKTGQVYIVKNFSSNDQGEYWCNATNSRGESIQWNNVPQTRLVDKKEILDSIKLEPESALVPVGGSFYFNCSADSRVELQWFKKLDDHNVAYVPVSTDLVTEHYNDHFYTIQLVMKNVRVNDSGLYQCRLTFNQKDKSSRKARLTVFDYEAPVIKSYSGQSTGSVVVRSPAKTSIYCTVVGYPLRTIQWYKNGQEIITSNCNDTEANPCKNGTKYWKSLRHLPNSKTIKSTLTIRRNDFPGDHGSYTCMANNSKARANATIFVNVLAGPKMSNKKYREIKVGLGISINKTCRATGNPLPDVVWTRTDDPNREVLASSKGKALLVVKDVKEKDLGNYTCNATNTVMSVTALLTIKESKEGKVLPLVKKEMPHSFVIGTVCGSVVFMSIVIIICCILYRRQQKRTRELKRLYFMKMGNTNYVIDPDRSLLEQCSNLPYDLDWEFPEERLILGEPLGSGAFGQVLKAEAIGMPAFKPRDKTSEARRLRSKVRKSRRKCKDGQNSAVTAKQTVAVKTLFEGASESDYKDLASELKILIHLGEHKNIVNVLGACTRGRRLLMIIEYAPHGDLLSFLRTKRDIYDPNWVKTSNNPEQEFTLVDLAMTAYQISRGMEFLASKKCVHRDLAARNVLVGENYVMKISDFGLARDIYQDDLYVKTTSGLLPVKWMALESLFDQVYTEKSDVWSFGIVLWEIFTLGGCPYPSVPLGELTDFLNNDNRMGQPLHCPQEMYDIMKDCWRKVPEQRPTFAELTVGIKRIIEKNAPKGNPQTCIEVVHEPMRASNEYLTSAETVPSSSRKTDPNANLAAQTPNSWIDDSTMNGAVPMNGMIEPEENSNSFFQKGGKGEKKPLLPQSSFSSIKQSKHINQHESAV